MTYVYLMKNGAPLNETIVKDHVAHLRELDRQGKLVLCGPFEDYPGGMVVFLAGDLAEAIRIASADPFVASGYKTFELRTLAVANADNNYLLTE